MEQYRKEYPSYGTAKGSPLTVQQQELLKKLEVYFELKKRKKRRKIKRILCILLAAAVILFTVWHFLIKPRLNREPDLLADDLLSVHFIDVGQGDSVFIEADGITMLIDSGEESASDQVISYLRELGVEKLNYVVATHPHADHMGGMYRVIDSFDIGEVIIPDIPDEDFPTAFFFDRFLDSCDSKDVDITEAEPGRFIFIGDARAEIVAPLSSKYDDLNDYSVSLFIRHGKKSFLLTGDAEQVSEKEMAESSKLRHTDVYKAGHHGSSSSSSKALLDVIEPDYAVISCGAGNSYGHPHDSVIKRLSAYTDKIYRTDLCGTIVFESDGNELTVSTER